MTINQYLPALLLFACTSMLSAQVSAGFDQLEQQQFEAAHKAFETALDDKSEAIPAKWGLALLLANSDYEMHNYDSAFVLKSQIEAGLRKNKDSRTKKKWARKYDLTSDGLKELAKPLPEKRWEELDGTKNLEAFDRYLRVFKNRIPSKKKPAFERQYDALIRSSVTGGATEYAGVNYLLKNHQKYIQDSFPGRLEPLKTLLFQYYLSENGSAPETVASFMKAQPAHAVSLNNARPDFESALKINGVTQWVKFIHQYPALPYTDLVYKRVAELLAINPVSSDQRNQLTEDERWVLEDIEAGHTSGLVVKPSSDYNGNGQEQWDRYIQRRAARSEGFRAMKSMLKYHIDQRNWALAEKTLHSFGPLFPQDSSWVRKMLVLVAGPDNGLRPITLKHNISTKGDEYSPAISYDGKTLAFCGTGRKESIWGEDIYITERKDSSWQDATISRDLSGSLHDAPMCFTADGNTMVIFKNGKVYTSNRTATGWGPAEAFPVDMSQFGWVSDVHFVPGEQGVFFAAR